MTSALIINRVTWHHFQNKPIPFADASSASGTDGIYWTWMLAGENMMSTVPSQSVSGIRGRIREKDSQPLTLSFVLFLTSSIVLFNSSTCLFM